MVVLVRMLYNCLWDIYLCALFLMKDFIDQNLPQFCMEQLSTCHMYLQVTTLVEITNQEYG